MRSTAPVLAATFFSATALAQTPLVQRRFSWDNLPYKADNDTGSRGAQFGYNRCNATTQNQQSACQTSVINSLDDFCLWAPPEPNSVVGNTEGEMVAWCTKSGYGTRIIPEGALTGVQFIKTPGYVQVTGRIRQELINIMAGDTGGEMDPHGADRRGNPLGGLLYSQSFSGNTTGGGSFTQVIEWHNFMGGNVFCLKACDPASPNAARMCEHIYDRIGCQYNAPAAYAENVFESCLGDEQLPPGIYVENGVTSTYTQPPESLGAIATMPYQPVTPASSQCTQYTSASIYTAGAPLSSASASANASSATLSASGSHTTVSGSAAAASTGASAAPSATSAAAASALWARSAVLAAFVAGLVAVLA